LGTNLRPDVPWHLAVLHRVTVPPSLHLSLFFKEVMKASKLGNNTRLELNMLLMGQK